MRNLDTRRRSVVYFAAARHWIKPGPSNQGNTEFTSKNLKKIYVIALKFQKYFS